MIFVKVQTLDGNHTVINPEHVADITTWPGKPGSTPTDSVITFSNKNTLKVKSTFDEVLELFKNATDL